MSKLGAGRFVRLDIPVDGFKVIPLERFLLDESDFAKQLQIQGSLLRNASAAFGLRIPARIARSSWMCREVSNPPVFNEFTSADVGKRFCYRSGQMVVSI